LKLELLKQLRHLFLTELEWFILNTALNQLIKNSDLNKMIFLIKILIVNFYCAQHWSCYAVCASVSETATRRDFHLLVLEWWEVCKYLNNIVNDEEINMLTILFTTCSVDIEFLAHSTWCNRNSEMYYKTKRPSQFLYLRVYLCK